MFNIIKANDIISWSETIYARSQFAILLRKLIHSTHQNLKQIDFAGNDDSQRAGWDGFLETDKGNAWIPAGKSGWEFGVDKDIKSKADGDIEKSIQAMGSECTSITFVFVTTRRWNRKNNWIQEQKNRNIWKDVRAYDASDLEQWLEQSTVAQIWFLEQINRPTTDVMSLESYWEQWANVSEPALCPELFKSNIEKYKNKINSKINDSYNPILITADSTEEGIAFVCQVFNDDDFLDKKDNVMIVSNASIISQLININPNTIIVTANREVEKEVAHIKDIVKFLIYPTKSISNADISLSVLDKDSFKKSLKIMGKTDDDIDMLINQSGRSITILRRLLSNIPAIKKPAWATNIEIAENLLPFLFVGVWSTKDEGDKEILEKISGKSFNELEKIFNRYIQIDDTPFWSISDYRGLTSKIDVLFAIKSAITEQDINHFLQITKDVLSEADPALDLEKEKRYLANIYQKNRKYSNRLRENILETLILLAVYGQSLFSIDLQTRISHLIHEILTPLTNRVLESNVDNFPMYAEVAPSELLSIIERDLRSETSSVIALLEPISDSWFQGSSRTGLLWALEKLAWHPDTFARSSYILAKLSETKIQDNLSNKPINSLKHIFRVYRPDTCASQEQKLEVLKVIMKRHPNVAWCIFVSIINDAQTFIIENHNYKWRENEACPEIDELSMIEFKKSVFEIMMSYQDYSIDKLMDFIELLYLLDDSRQNQFWNLVDSLLEKEILSDKDKTKLRDKIRQKCIINSKKLKHHLAKLTEKGEQIYQKLEPENLIEKYLWLFKSHWVELSEDDLDNEVDCYDKKQELIKEKRTSALKEIFRNNGTDGILSIFTQGNCYYYGTDILVNSVFSNKDIEEILEKSLIEFLKNDEQATDYSIFISNMFCSMPDVVQKENLISGLTNNLSDNEKLKLYLILPFNKLAWSFVDLLDEELREQYWLEVQPNYCQPDEELEIAISYLLSVGRAKVAFRLIEYHLNKIDALTIYQILDDLLKSENNKDNEYLPNQYYFKEAFKLLNNSDDVDSEKKAYLEFAYINILKEYGNIKLADYGPNLSQYIFEHPEFFAEMISFIYKRKDGIDDFNQGNYTDEQLRNLQDKYYNIIHDLSFPNLNREVCKIESAKLLNWIYQVRKLCSESNRLEITDLNIGKMLAHSPVDSEDNIFPCNIIRDIMEDIQSEYILDGAYTEVYNSRGAVIKSLNEGGQKEYVLATQYQDWANQLKNTHPFVANYLLQKVADAYFYEAKEEDLNVEIRQRIRD